jgi:F-type H+-transporting ATPase subunit b
MDETLRQLGGILLRALPTFFLVVLLHFYLKLTFFKPLKKVLRDRYDATEGARKLAEASLEKASRKASEYEAALRSARGEIYKELEQMRRGLQEERAAAVRAARTEAEAAVAKAKVELGAEAENLKQSLQADSESLANQIVDKILGGRAA